MKALFALSLLLAGSLAAADLSFPKQAIATVHPLATQAGMDAFAKGGNAIDAAIAAGLTLGVVDGHNSGIGGGCFFVIRAADGTVTCIDGREMAPAKAHRDMYVINGKLDDEASGSRQRARNSRDGAAHGVDRERVVRDVVAPAAV